MNYKIIPQKHFLKEVKRLAKKYRSLKQDLQALQDELSGNPFAGTDLGGGVRKLRMAIGSKNRGKSHGARVITYTYTVDETEGIVNLIFIYDKEERESISKNEIDELIIDLRLELLRFFISTRLNLCGFKLLSVSEENKRSASEKNNPCLKY